MNKENKVLVKAGAEVILAPTVYKMLSSAVGKDKDDDNKTDFTKFEHVLQTIGKVVMTAVVAEFASDFVVKRIDTILKAIATKG